MTDNERINTIIAHDPCLKHRFFGCFADDTFPVSDYREGRFAIVNTSLITTRAEIGSLLHANKTNYFCMTVLAKTLQHSSQKC